MVEAPSIILAFAAGVLSFLSPCCLPLVPGYLAAITGGATLQTQRPRRTVVLVPSLLFIATFSAIFVALGLGATSIGGFLTRHLGTLDTIAGATIIALGVLLVGSVPISGLNRDWHHGGLMQRVARGGPIVAGAAFAIAWTPCVGPTLAAILALASTEGGVLRGGALLAVYSLGLGVPFLATALTLGGAGTRLPWLRRHGWVIQVVGGTMLVAMGWLILSGDLLRLNIAAQDLMRSVGLDALSGL